MSDREQFYTFDCPQLDLKRTTTDELMFHYLNYVWLVGHVEELGPSQRGQAIDIGCGSGYGTEMLGLYFGQVWGYDTDQTAIKYASIMHGRTGVIFQTPMEPKPEGTMYPNDVDFACMIESLEHMSKAEAAGTVETITKLLAPHGIFCLTTPIAKSTDGGNPGNKFHIHEYKPDELGKMLQKHFHKVEIEPIGNVRMSATCYGPKK